MLDRMTSSDLHSGYHSSVLRSWQSAGTQVTATDLVLPVFVTDSADDAVEDIVSMPGVKRFGVGKLVEFLRPLTDLGLQSILLFGVLSNPTSKDPEATCALDRAGPAPRAIQLLKETFPHLVIIADVCMCPYSSHGHCGYIDEDGHIINEPSIARMADIALLYAECGADIVAPSDMMDGRVKAIKDRLRAHRFGSKVAVMSYSSKFASSLYGPFRDAAKSAPGKGDRSAYQLPSGSRGLALRAARRDISEGADFVMVKPAMWYLDIIRDIANESALPVAAYQVSGEYSMIYHAAKSGSLDLKTAVFESLTALKRAGANILITYFTAEVLYWLSNTERLS